MTDLDPRPIADAPLDDTWSVSDLFKRQRAKARELGTLKRELGNIEAQELQQRHATFRNLNDGTRNITTIRAEVEYNVTDTAIERIGIQGEIDEVTAELRWIEKRIDYLPYLVGR